MFKILLLPFISFSFLFAENDSFTLQKAQQEILYQKGKIQQLEEKVERLSNNQKIMESNIFEKTVISNSILAKRHFLHLKVLQDVGQKIIPIKIDQNGYVQIRKNEKIGCSVYLLDKDNKEVARATYNSNGINKKVPDGEYLIQIIPKETKCTINIIY